MVQIAWHLALDLDNPLTNALREVYLLTGSAGRQAVSHFADLVVPALIAGFAFSRLCASTTLLQSLLFSAGIGAMLSSAQLLYALLVSYTMWWEKQDATGGIGAFVLHGLVGLGFCFLTAWMAPDWKRKVQPPKPPPPERAGD